MNGLEKGEMHDIEFFVFTDNWVFERFLCKVTS